MTSAKSLGISDTVRPDAACPDQRPDRLSLSDGARNDVPTYRTLTLDLGTKTGWALMESSTVTISDTIVLATQPELLLQRSEGKERTCDLRFHRLLDFINRHLGQGVTRIVWEDVQFIRSQCQAQLWSSLRTAIWAAVQSTNVAVHCVSAPALKYFATGDIAADKRAMGKALGGVEPLLYRWDDATNQLWRNGNVVDDNEIDAIWLARFATAVDRRERDWLSVYQRKVLKKEERRARRRAVKAAKKAKRLGSERAAKSQRRVPLS